jgi:hypothetical protein
VKGESDYGIVVFCDLALWPLRTPRSGQSDQMDRRYPVSRRVHHVPLRQRIARLCDSPSAVSEGVNKESSDG